jgi:hypothetical protein
MLRAANQRALEHCDATAAGARLIARGLRPKAGPTFRPRASGSFAFGLGVTGPV